MTLEIYYKPDIANNLLAAEKALAVSGRSDEYKEGFGDALEIIATSFGLTRVKCDGLCVWHWRIVEGEVK